MAVNVYFSIEIVGCRGTEDDRILKGLVGLRRSKVRLPHRLHHIIPNKSVNIRLYYQKHCSNGRGCEASRDLKCETCSLVVIFWSPTL